MKLVSFGLLTWTCFAMPLWAIPLSHDQSAITTEHSLARRGNAASKACKNGACLATGAVILSKTVQKKIQENRLGRFSVSALPHRSVIHYKEPKSNFIKSAHHPIVRRSGIGRAAVARFKNCVDKICRGGLKMTDNALGTVYTKGDAFANEYQHIARTFKSVRGVAAKGAGGFVGGYMLGEYIKRSNDGNGNVKSSDNGNGNKATRPVKSTKKLKKKKAKAKLSSITDTRSITVSETATPSSSIPDGVRSTDTPSIAVSETATPDSAPSPPESEIPAAPASDTSV